MMTVRTIRSQSGQATTELALMMLIIFALFFWAFQVNILMEAYHQAAYASFMAARGFEVQRQGRGDPDKIQGMILTGQVFTNIDGGQKPSAAPSCRGQCSDSLWNDNDGVKLDLPGFGSLPYVHKLLTFPTSVPTHLGPNEYDFQHWSDLQHRDDFGRCNLTDNNLPDNKC